MKPGEPSGFRKSRFGGTAIKNIWGKPLGFVLLAFVIGATISQASFAFADDSSTNPFRAIWDAINELQTKTDSLQSQLDDLRSQQGTTTAIAQPATRTSDVSVAIDVAGGQSGQTLVTLIARNSGPDNAVGAKLTVFYQTSLLQINFIQSADCYDGSRGIIECYLGTIPAGSEIKVTIDAIPKILDQQAIITADLSSITKDTNPADNHAEVAFVTAIVPVTQLSPVQTTPLEEPAPTEQEQTGEQEVQDVDDEQNPQETEQSSEHTDQGTSEESGDLGELGEGPTGDEPNTDAEASSEGESTDDAGAGESSEDGGAGSTDDTGNESTDDAGAGESSEDGGAGSTDDTGNESTDDAGEPGSEESSDDGSSTESDSSGES